jgi:tetratricopeptide (TPR) repeat protein
MAPEQIAPGAVRLDRRVDVYALGVSMFEALTMLHPFEAPTLEAAVRLGDAKDLRQLDPRFPRDLALILATAMRRDRDRRYVTALALAEDLRAFRLGRRIAARPPSVARRLGDWAARHPATAAASTVAAVSLVAGLAVSLHLLAETRDALKQTTAANEAKTKAHAEAMRLVEFMLGDLQKQLAEVGRTDLLVSVTETAKKHFDSMSMDDLSVAELVTVADAWASLGMAYEKQSRREEQIECRKRALDIRERLYAGDPKNPTYAERLADSLRPRGRLLSSYGRLDDAVETYVRADKLTTGLPPEIGESPRVRVARCDILVSLADFYRRFGRTDEMWAMLRRATPIGESALRDGPADVDALHQALRAVLATAAARDAAGDSTAARALADDALRRARAFVTAYPEKHAAKEDVADALAAAAECAIDRGDLAAAERLTAESLDTCAELRERDPRNARWFIQEIMANERTARVLHARGKASAAVDAALAACAPAAEKMKTSPEPQGNPEALTVVARCIRTYAAALRSAGSIDDALARLKESGELLARAADIAPQDLNVQLGIVLQRNELETTLGEAASRGAAASDLPSRALVAFEEGDAVARRVLAAHPDAAKFERQRAFILRDGAAVRLATGDRRGAATALEEAVRIRDALAKTDALFVARLADLDALLADARRTAGAADGTK